ncbi:metal ABC transporter permease [bacterium]|jgi:manganese/zinc/iron transport system permease protein|nr:metal ABC transporter permease [bacterium]
MIMPQLEIMLIGSVVAVACVLPGVFLVLRGVALMSDAISHSILLGIILSFLVVRTLDSPLLIIGASLAGVLTVSLTEMLIRTKRIKKDAAIGLVFPVFFSIGVILICLKASNVHIDTDAVLLGELAFAPFHRMIMFGIDVGPHALWVMGVILVLNVALLIGFYKELKLSTFDSGLAASLGFSPVLVHYGLMTVTSVTAVGAFDAVGSILVVALMITPPATAFLLTERLPRMIGLSVLFGVLSAVAGYGFAHALDASIAGSMATMTGLFFTLALLFSPSQGLVTKFLTWKEQQVQFSAQMLAVQLLSHEGTDIESSENTIDNMVDHMGWRERDARRITRYAVQQGYIQREEKLLSLTPFGRELARKISIS